MERVTFEDFIKMYPCRDILFNIRPASGVMCYVDNMPTFNPETLPNIPPEERRVTDLISYSSLHVPYISKSSVRMEQKTDFEGKNKVPTYENTRKIFDENATFVHGRGIKVAIDAPPLYLILGDYFENIRFSYSDSMAVTIKEKYNFDVYDGRFTIRIPRALHEKGLNFFKKFYNGGMALGETTYGLFSSSGLGLKHEYLLFLDGDFMELEDFKKFVRTIKLFNNPTYEKEIQNGLVTVYISGNFKKCYYDGIFSNNRLPNADKILGEYNYGKG